MIQLYWPGFFLLIPLPFLVRRFLPPVKDPPDSTPELHFPWTERLKKAFPTNTSKAISPNIFSLTLLSLAWIFIVLALMRPEKAEHYVQINNTGYDLMLAVDTSASMQALDFSTSFNRLNRLDVTKEVVGKFVRGRQGDRIGLVTFGEHAYLHVPLTLDTFSVSKMLNDTTPGMAGNRTAIGDAIGISIRTLRERPEGSRVLILLTDGEDNASHIPPLKAAEIAKQYGIRIYTVGVGSNGAVPFPTRFGGVGMAEVSLDEKLLKDIAQMTGGQYFHATDKEALASIYQTINELEKTEANQKVYLIKEPLYHIPLGLAMICLFTLALQQIYRRGHSGF